jgi:hypothetical protein
MELDRRLVEYLDQERQRLATTVKTVPEIKIAKELIAIST